MGDVMSRDSDQLNRGMLGPTGERSWSDGVGASASADARLDETRRGEHREEASTESSAGTQGPRREAVLREQLDRMRRLASLGMLAGGVAHDLNNVLTAINGFLQLGEFELPEGHPVRGYLGAARASCGRAGTLAQRMLTIAHAAEGMPHPVRIDRLVAAELERWQVSLPNSVRLVSRVKEDCPEVLCEEWQLAEAIFELLRTAAEASRAGGAVTLEVKRIDVTPELRAAHPQFAWDTAVRIVARSEARTPGQENPRGVVEPFFAGCNPDRVTGLELAVVFSLARRCRGAAMVDRDEQGAEAWLYLPLADAVEKRLMVAGVIAPQAACT
jgi:signal transduction histidine kinase